MLTIMQVVDVVGEHSEPRTPQDATSSNEPSTDMIKGPGRDGFSPLAMDDLPDTPTSSLDAVPKVTPIDIPLPFTSMHSDTALSPQSARQMPLEPVSPHRIEHPSARPRNIVIFGESGVGKSSVINMIAGHTVTRTSNDAIGCTFHHECHPVTLGDASIHLWDTAGLDEGSEGTVPAAQAEEKLKLFLRQVTRSNGIDLLIYCIRGTRVRRALLRNYNIFYAAICRKKVPVALVITGLENYEGEMEMWWVEHEKDLRKHDMRFDAHACVTTTTSDHPAIQERREHSQRILRELVQQHFISTAWIANENSLLSASLPDVRALMGAMWNGERRMVPVVTICDMAQSEDRIRLAPGIRASWEKCTGFVLGREYQFYRVSAQILSGDTQERIRSEPKKGSDLLVFYAAVDAPHDAMWSCLKRFYELYGGETSPLIIVFRGLDSQDAATAMWTEFTSSHGREISAHPTFFPGPDSSPESVERADDVLFELIDSKCLQRFAGKPKRFQRVLRYGKELVAGLGLSRQQRDK